MRYAAQLISRTRQQRALTEVQRNPLAEPAPPGDPLPVRARLNVVAYRSPKRSQLTKSVNSARPIGIPDTEPRSALTRKARSSAG
jgi:hypothetical protein